MSLKKFTDYRGTIAKEEWNDAWDLMNSNVVSKTTTYTATVNDGIILCNGTFTVTLLTAVGISGKMMSIKNTGTGTVTVACNGAETIDASATQALVQDEVITIISDNANWYII